MNSRYCDPSVLKLIPVRSDMSVPLLSSKRLGNKEEKSPKIRSSETENVHGEKKKIVPLSRILPFALPLSAKYSSEC